MVLLLCLQRRLQYINVMPTAAPSLCRFENVACQEPEPFHGPNGWGRFADVVHVDFQVPSEHLIWGEGVDVEIHIFHLHPSRRRMATSAVMIKAMDTGFMYCFEEALKAFQCF